MKQQFLWYWHQARTNSDLWEKGNKLCKPMIVYFIVQSHSAWKRKLGRILQLWTEVMAVGSQGNILEKSSGAKTAAQKENSSDLQWLPLEFSAEYWSVHVSEKAIFLRPGKNNLGQWILQHKGKRQIPWKTSTIKLHYRRNRCLSL